MSTFIKGRYPSGYIYLHKQLFRTKAVCQSCSPQLDTNILELLDSIWLKNGTLSAGLDDWTLPHVAAGQGSTQLAQQLLSAGCDPCVLHMDG